MGHTTAPQEPATDSVDPAAHAVQDSLESRILVALDVRLPRSQPSRVYRLAVVLVSVAMLLLPLLYVALVGAVGYGLLQFAVHFAVLFEDGVSVGDVVVYAGPILVLGILLLFMVKPLFAPSLQSENRLTVSRRDQPFLFQYLEALCRAVGAPVPGRVVLDCEVNASAGFHQGARQGRNGLELTIGLPLVENLNLREFTGVLAHEFGHFAQGAGMRTSYVIRRISFWLQRAVFERDAWDERLDHWSRNGVLWTAPIFLVARLFVSLTRKVLFALLWISGVVSFYLARQMEFDADRYEVWMSGVDSFEASMHKLPELAVAQEFAYEHLSSAWEAEARVVDDLPALIRHEHENLDAELQERIRESLENEKCDRWATHPRSMDRIAAAHGQGSAGVFEIEAPAAVLFQGYRDLCRMATLYKHEDALDRPLASKELVPLQEFVGRQKKESDELESLRTFCQEQLSTVRPWPWVTLEDETLTVEATVEEVTGLRRRVEHGAKAYDLTGDEYFEAYNDALRMDIAAELIEAGVKIRNREVGLERRDPELAREAGDRARRKAERLRSQLASYENACARRLALDLWLLQESPATELAEEVERLRPAVSASVVAQKRSMELRTRLAVLEAFGNQLEEGGQAVADALMKRAEELQEHLETMRAPLTEVEYPFDHSGGRQTLAEYALREVPEAEELGALFEAGHRAADELDGLYVRLLARLARIAEQVEQEHGLEPLPAPEAGEVVAGV